MVLGGAQFWEVQDFILKEWTSNGGIPGKGNVTVSEKNSLGIGNVSWGSSFNKCPLSTCYLCLSPGITPCV